MPGTCCVCQDEMEMEDFNDPRQSTNACFKLACGHAYHTQCIFQYMAETDYQCLHCNSHRTPREEIELTGLIAQTIEELRGDPELRRLRSEVDEAMTEFVGVRNEFQKALEVIAAEMEGRTGYAAIRKETLQRIRNLKTHIKTECIRRNPLTAGVWGIAGVSLLMRAFVPRSTRGLYTHYMYLKI